MFLNAKKNGSKEIIFFQRVLSFVKSLKIQDSNIFHEGDINLKIIL